MTTTVVAFLLAFLVAFTTTPLVRALAPRLGAVDKPDGYRKVHRRPTPLMGGVAVYLGFVAPLAALMLFMPGNHLAQRMCTESANECIGLLVAGTIVLVVGALDDIYHLDPALKLLGQFVAAAVACSFGLEITAVSNPLTGQAIDLGWFAIPLTIFWFLGAMNAVNLIDGLDGLASGIALFVAMSLLVVSVLFQQIVPMLLLACFGGGLLGFLMYNFHPASIFLGDTGSLLLGFLLAGLALMGSRKSSAAVALFIPIIALGLPIFDTALAMLRRWSRNLPVSAADRQHFHHVLLRLGLHQRTVVMIMYAVTVVLCSAAVLVASARNEVILVVFGALTVIAFVSVRVIGGIRARDLLDKLNHDWHRVDDEKTANLAVHVAMQRLADAPDLDTAWRACCESFTGLHLDRVSLVVAHPDGERHLYWSRHHDREQLHAELEPDTWAARFALGDRSHRDRGYLHVSSHLDRLATDATPHPEQVSRLCLAMAGHLERLLSAKPAPATRAATDSSTHTPATTSAAATSRRASAPA